MRLAILSDIHDQQENLRQVLARLRPLAPEALIVCGDLTRPEVLEACKALCPRLAFCLGNCDTQHADELKRSALVLGAAVWESLGCFPLPGGETVAFSHFPAVARRAASEGGHRAVFFGHTHKRFDERLGSGPGAGTLLANPGDVQGRYGRAGGLLWDSADSTLTWVDA
jgi:putative phosphoesterase